MPRDLPYTNRKGYTYHLYKTSTKTGKPRYVFSRALSKDALREVPPGYRIVESINGVVSLAKAGASPIAEEEIRIVRSALARDPRLARYGVEARKKALVVFEPIGGLGADMAEFGRLTGLPVQYAPVFRFTLVDEAKREFLAERMCYRASVDGWLPLNDVGTIRKLARRYLPHLGRESFYELY
ncbi:MAG: hypothetical protein HY716_10640 [Planctomycetes bacterium]|nr:hypothetical protein [Planctomycetota bacterium]